MVRLACSSGATAALEWARMTSGASCDKLRGVLAHDVGVAGAPAIIDPDVLADGPTRLLETLGKRRETGLRFRIVGREPHQDANPADALRRLRAGA